MNIKQYVTISEGNSKLGEISNISLPPIETCIENPPCAKDCYPKVYMKRWPKIKEIYEKNLRTYKNDPELYFKCIRTYIEKEKPKYFRWHVAGDIPDLYYLNQMHILAITNIDTKFMVFTKKYKYVENDISQWVSRALNSPLRIILSAWPGLELPVLTDERGRNQRYPIAFLEDDERRHNYLKCEGKCDACGKCWELKDLRKNVCLKRL